MNLSSFVLLALHQRLGPEGTEDHRRPRQVPGGSVEPLWLGISGRLPEYLIVPNICSNTYYLARHAVSGGTPITRLACLAALRASRVEGSTRRRAHLSKSEPTPFNLYRVTTSLKRGDEAGRLCATTRTPCSLASISRRSSVRSW